MNAQGVMRVEEVESICLIYPLVMGLLDVWVTTQALARP